MTDKIILDKALTKALSNGYTTTKGVDPSVLRFDEIKNHRIYWSIHDTRAEQSTPYMQSSVYGTIFSHDFAKAFWEEEEIESTLWRIFNPPVEGEPVTYVGTYVLRWGKEPEPTVAFAPAELPAWQYHIQQMVLEENPIQYLKKFL